MTRAPESAPPKRPRMTKAEREADRAAKAAAEELAKYKPIDPRIWMLLGAVLLLIALWTWLDPVTFAETQQGQNGGIVFAFPSALISIFSKMPVVIVLTILGGIPFLSGLIGWLRSRFGQTDAD